VNILPLIFTFLILFTCIASTFSKEVKSFFLSETTLNSFDRTERKMNNTIACKAYRKMKGEPINKKESGEKKPKQSTYFSRRSFFPSFENSKFNIRPLIKDEGELKLHPLFEPLAEMLRLLYKRTLFDRESHSEKIEYRLLEAILNKARKHPEAKDLSELCPDDLTLRSLYYKLLKGTNQYRQKESIPPLGDFVTLRKEGAAIFFSFASPTLLTAIFDHATAEHILEEERKKWEQSNKYYYFSKEDLQSLLMKNPSLASKYTTLESYLDYSKQIRARKEIGSIDPKTGLSIKKPSIL
jgi:hypothetical protein